MKTMELVVGRLRFVKKGAGGGGVKPPKPDRDCQADIRIFTGSLRRQSSYVFEFI